MCEYSFTMSGSSNNGKPHLSFEGSLEGVEEVPQSERTHRTPGDGVARGGEDRVDEAD